MSGNILKAAKRDAKKFVLKGGFQVGITITNPTSGLIIQTTGLATKHHISFDTDGNAINAKNVHICIDESDLIKKGYIVRNSNKEITLLNHIVSYADSSEEEKKYIVLQNYPDEVLGLIVCVLGDYN